MISQYFQDFDFLNLAVSSAGLSTTLLEAAFAASSLAFVAVSNSSFPHLSARFLENGQNQYPLTIFLVVGSIA